MCQEFAKAKDLCPFLPMGIVDHSLGVKVDSKSKAVEPNEETVLGQTYPIWRYLYNYVNPTLDKDEIHAHELLHRGERGTIAGRSSR